MIKNIDCSEMFNMVLSCATPEKIPSLPSLAADWCKTKTAKEAGVCGCKIVISGIPSKAKAVFQIDFTIAKIVDGLYDFPADELIDYLKVLN